MRLWHRVTIGREEEKKRVSRPYGTPSFEGRRVVEIIHEDGGESFRSFQRGHALTAGTEKKLFTFTEKLVNEWTD
jgi:hypothetical protein